MPEHATITAISDHVHLSRARTRDLLMQAGIYPDAQGKFDRDAALTAIDQTRDPSRTVGKRAATADAAAIDKASDKRAGALGELAAARAESERQRAVKLRLENDRLVNSLLPRETVVRAGEAFARHVREGLRGFANAVAAKVANRDADDVARILDDEVYALLVRLGDPLPFIEAQLSQ